MVGKVVLALALVGSLSLAALLPERGAPGPSDPAAAVFAANGTPPPTNRPKPGPVLSIAQRSMDVPADPLAYPFDFHFAYRLGGVGFRPGEQVTISVQHHNVAPTIVTADSSGSFVTQLTFTWIFCGAGGVRRPAPVFLAAGNKGSRATTAEKAPSCPLLAAWEQSEAPSGGGSPGTSPGQGSAPFPTVAPAPTLQPGSPPGLQPAPSQPASPLPPARVLVEGFGFTPHDTVSLHVHPDDGSSSRQLTDVTADSKGRFRFTAEMQLPRWQTDCPPVQVRAADGQGVVAAGYVARAANAGGPPQPLVPCVGGGSRVPHVKVSANVALIPTGPHVTVSPLARGKVHVSWRRALRAAKASWGVTAEQVDVIVRAAVSDDSLYGAGWVVVANLVSHNPAPGNTTVYDKMVIVVDGRSGNVLFAYPADPH